MTACANHAGVPASAYCRTCGKPLCENCKRDVKGVVYCEECIAARLAGTAPPPTWFEPGSAAAGTVAGSNWTPPNTPNPTLAAFLGIIPGVGAFYNGQYQKGVAHVLMFVALIMLANQVDVFGVLFPFYFLYMMWDAYMTAKSRITGEKVPDPLGINNMFGLDSEPASPPAAAPVAGSSAVPPAAPSTSFANAPIGAFALIGLGILFLLGDISRHIVHDFWPVILIAIGVWKGIAVWEVGKK